MALFAGIAATLTILALGSALWPLRRQSYRALLGGVALLGLAGFALYRIVGTPAALAASASTGSAPRTLDEAIAQLRDVLQRDPDQVEGWLLLGRALTSQQKLIEARDAFARALPLAPDQPDVLVAAAQARLLAAPAQRPDATVIRLLERALALQPGHQRARWLLGVAQRNDGQPAQAASTWQPLLIELDTDARARLREQIDQARREAAARPPTGVPDAQ